VHLRKKKEVNSLPSRLEFIAETFLYFSFLTTRHGHVSPPKKTGKITEGIISLLSACASSNVRPFHSTVYGNNQKRADDFQKILFEVFMCFQHKTAGSNNKFDAQY